MQTGEEGQRLLSQSISQMCQLKLLTGNEGSNDSVYFEVVTEEGERAEGGAKHLHDKEQSSFKNQCQVFKALFTHSYFLQLVFGKGSQRAKQGYSGNHFYSLWFDLAGD